MPVRVIKLPALGQPAYALMEENGELTPSSEDASRPLLFESYNLAEAALREIRHVSA